MPQSQVVTQYPHFINGEKREPVSRRYIPVLNPATNQMIAEAAEGTAEDVDIAVASAREAFQSVAWRQMPADERSRRCY
jgi:acyl-CoA reductase-like NAD-dependent aldehyde dehydrogenase